MIKHEVWTDTFSRLLMIGRHKMKSSKACKIIYSGLLKDSTTREILQDLPVSELLQIVEDMKPMFPSKIIPGRKRPESGKYSFEVEKRVEIFSFIIDQIRKYSDCTIALCRESRDVWDRVGLDLSRCGCVCQLNSADLSDR